MDLTDRQKNLLRVVIEKYIETAEAVGSETIEKEGGLGVSPATIRNEMVKLTSLGYLRQPHTSAGRTPTSLGMKFYVDQLMEEKSLSLKDEVAIKEELGEQKEHFNYSVTPQKFWQIKLIIWLWQLTRKTMFMQLVWPIFWICPNFMTLILLKPFFQCLIKLRCSPKYLVNWQPRIRLKYFLVKNWVCLILSPADL